MASSAGLCQVRMFIDKGALVFHVTACAGVLDGHPPEVLVMEVTAAMGVVTVCTDHLMFIQRMVRELAELQSNLLVTSEAKLVLLLAADFLLWPLVQLVAIKTADAAVRVDASGPAMKVGRGCCGMTLEAGH